MEIITASLLRTRDYDEPMAKAKQLLNEFKYAEAFEAIRPAAQKEYPPALRLAGDIILFMPATKDNSADGYNLLAAAALKGDCKAQLEYLWYKYNDAFSRIWRLERQANAGDTTAMTEMAERIYKGGKSGVPRQKHRAAQLFLKAADGGNLRAQYLAGLMYLNGKGVDLNREKGAKMIIAAANGKLPFAYPEAAKVFLSGKGVVINYGEGLKWVMIAKNTPGLNLDSELIIYANSALEKAQPTERQQAFAAAKRFLQQAQ